MFFSHDLLGKRGALDTLWTAAHMERRLKRKQIDGTDISASVGGYSYKPTHRLHSKPRVAGSKLPERVLGSIGRCSWALSDGDRPGLLSDGALGEVAADSIMGLGGPLRLRITAILLHGVVRVHSRQVSFLHSDCNEAVMAFQKVCAAALTTFLAVQGYASKPSRGNQPHPRHTPCTL